MSHSAFQMKVDRASKARRRWILRRVRLTAFMEEMIFFLLSISWVARGALSVDVTRHRLTRTMERAEAMMPNGGVKFWTPIFLPKADDLTYLARVVRNDELSIFAPLSVPERCRQWVR